VDVYWSGGFDEQFALVVKGAMLVRKWGLHNERRSMEVECRVGRVLPTSVWGPIDSHFVFKEVFGKKAK
jgi:hypothetical protein